MNELTGWVLGHKAEQKQAQEQQQQMLQDQQEIERRKSKNRKHRRKSPAYRTPDVPPNGANLQRYHRLESILFFIYFPHFYSRRLLQERSNLSAHSGVRSLVSVACLF